MPLPPVPTGPAVLEKVRVRYAETDAQGVVYHSNHLVYFEVGRGAFLRACGFDYNQMEADGVIIVVVEATCRYMGAARYDDELVVATRLHELGRSSCAFSYELLNGPQRIAQGLTTHVCLDRASHRPVAIPVGLREALARLQA